MIVNSEHVRSMLPIEHIPYEETLANNFKGAKITANVSRLIKKVDSASDLTLSLREISNHRNWHTAWLELSPVVFGWFFIESLFWKAKS